MCLYLRTQAMNLSIGHTRMFVDYQTTWSQPVTLIIPCKTNILPTLIDPMRYKVIPSFVPIDPCLYPTYPTKTK
jgi:hypothetical protein